MRNWLNLYITAFVLLFSMFSNAAEVSSGNAANDYKKCLQRFKKPDAALWKQVRDISTSMPPTLPPELARFVQAQRKNSLVADIDAATKIKNCDWKLDYTKGYEMQMPPLGELKDLATLLRADALLAAAQGDSETAIDRNLAIWRMGHHCLGTSLSTEHLVCLNLIRMSETGLRQTLSTSKVSPARLMLLKTELKKDSYQIPPFKDLIQSEKEMMRQIFPKTKFEMLEIFFVMSDSPESAKKEKQRILRYFEPDDPNIPNDPDWIAASVRYMEDCCDTFIAALEKPYPDAMTEMDQIHQKAVSDFREGNDAAFLFEAFMPAFQAMYTISIRTHTECNALLTAIDVYRAAKMKGQIPNRLPNSTYVDSFSGKPFIYEITQDGFRLRCRQEDIRKKQIWEWEFTLKK